MRDEFETVAGWLEQSLRGEEVFTAHLAAESSDFARFNAGRVRQAGSVVQRELHVDWIEGRRHAVGTLTLSGRPAIDRPLVAALVSELRTARDDLPEDPHLLYASEPHSSEIVRSGRSPAPEEVLDAVTEVGRAHDFVGIHAAGTLYRGFASSLGQRNWFASESHQIDWSLCGEDGSAVKSSCGGADWSREDFLGRAARAAEQLRALERPPHPVSPGRYRVYLAPAALSELFDLLGWGGFGLRAHRTKASPLLRLSSGEAALSESIHLREDTAAGIAPNFESAGFLRPDTVDLVSGGRFAGCLVSPRSAVEYAAVTNGAGAAEAPLSLDMAAGALPVDDVLREIGSGIYVSNLWYLNYSDRPACRTTGMTRFATFWVEGGQLAAPVPAMRFDETLYRLLGEHLVALTREREMLLASETYGRRSTRSQRLPGALVDDFTLTL